MRLKMFSDFFLIPPDATDVASRANRSRALTFYRFTASLLLRPRGSNKLNAAVAFQKKRGRGL